MLLDKFGGAEHNGALRIDQEGWYGGVISTFSVLEIGTLWCPRPTKEIWRKLRFSAFQWFYGLGVADRVFIMKY
jgi:hypothetical protein